MSTTPYQSVLNSLLSHNHIFISPPTSPHKLHIAQTSSSPTTTISSISLHPVIESLLHILNLDLPSAHFLCRHAEVAPKWESMYVHGILHRVEGDIANTRAWYGNVRDSEVFKSVWEGVERGSQEDDKLPTIAKLGWKVFLERLEGYRDRTKKRREQKERTRRESNASASTGSIRNPSRSPTVSSNVPSQGHHEDGNTASDAMSNDGGAQTGSETADWEAEGRLLAETSLWEILRVLRFCEHKFGTNPLDVQGAKNEFVGRIESGDERLAKIAEGMVTGGEGWRDW